MTTTRILRAAVVVVTIVACKGESPTDPGEVNPYDLVVERRDGASGPPDLIVLNLATGEERRLFTSQSVGGMHPHGSTDGDRVVFVRSDAEFNSEVFIVNSDGTGLTNVSNHAQADVMPAWSPAGGRIAFVTDRAGFQDIFVVNNDGTGLRRLTTADPEPAVTTEWWPAWSPSTLPGGQRIAYSSTIDGTPDIWTTTVDAPVVTRERITGTPDADTHPTWSEDGTRIAFERRDVDTGEADIVVLTLSTRTIQRIPLPGQQLTPAWSPDGEFIAFASNHEGDLDLEIYTMRPDGTEIMRRTTNGAFDLRPTWLLR
ncbi:MAG: hypothetical protein M3303_08615 [Gemmatimonadota bacterium]|nr:hypothetical protein [Gemmatimonadota bacterium]